MSVTFVWDLHIQDPWLVSRILIFQIATGDWSQASFSFATTSHSEDVIYSFECFLIIKLNILHARDTESVASCQVKSTKLVTKLWVVFCSTFILKAINFGSKFMDILPIMNLEIRLPNVVCDESLITRTWDQHTAIHIIGHHGLKHGQKSFFI
jgi:hypothetical protein